MIEHYFAYGSNMNPTRVAARGLRVVRIQPALLKDFSLLFDKLTPGPPQSGHANVAPQRGATVEGVLYELAGIDEIYKMDPFEKAPVNYGRDVIGVHTNDGPVNTWVYFANSALRVAGLSPTRDYLTHLLEGRPYLSKDYFEWLRQTRCIDEG
ncbi:MAG: gamma-glutamylcyclotransferase [Proteobacteria bacterium]|nr:gamma-glutamylcyclotransferase [Pseudomonadota bacterium]